MNADFIRLICENLRSEAKRLYLRPNQSPAQIRQTPVEIYDSSEKRVKAAHRWGKTAKKPGFFVLQPYEQADSAS